MELVINSMRQIFTGEADGGPFGHVFDVLYDIQGYITFSK
jgi:hypothetical protein